MLSIFITAFSYVLVLTIITPALYVGISSLLALYWWRKTRSKLGNETGPHAGLDLAHGAQGTIAFVIPAHNEETVIERTIQSIKQCRDQNFSINIVADNCTDNTASIGTSLGCNVYVRNDKVNKSKGHALAWLIPQVIRDHKEKNGQIPLAIVVIDADATISPDSVTFARRRFASGVNILQSLYTLEEGQSIRSKVMTIAFSAINVVRGYARSAMGVGDTFKGNGMWFRTSVLVENPWRAFSLAEDLEFGLMLRKKGYKIEFFYESKVTGLPGDSSQASDNQRARWEGGRLSLVLNESAVTLRQWIRQPSLEQFDLLMELVTPPLTYYTLTLFVGLGISILVATTAATLFAVALALVSLHFLLAVLLGEHPKKIIFALFGVPFFFLWKIILLPRIWRDRKSKDWIRTDRIP